MTSNKKHQLELLPSEQAHVEAISPDLVARVCRKETFLDAWLYAQDISCLADKTVYSHMELDKSHYGKIKDGKASPPADERFMRYFEINKTEIPLIWLAEKLGYDFMSMRKHYATDADRRVAELEEENTALRRIVALGVRK